MKLIGTSDTPTGNVLYNVLCSWRGKMMLWKYCSFFATNYHLGYVGGMLLYPKWQAWRSGASRHVSHQ